jgi:hypothetical protein
MSSGRNVTRVKKMSQIGELTFNLGDINAILVSLHKDFVISLK